MKKILNFNELSDDIENKKFNINIESDKSGSYEIESIIDIILDPNDIRITEGNIIGVPSDLTNKEVKRGDFVFITAMIRKSGSSSFSSPAVQGILKLRVVDIYNNLSYLNKVLNK